MSKVGRVPALREFTPPPLSAKNHTVGQQVKMMSFSQTKKSGKFCLFVCFCLFRAVDLVLGVGHHGMNLHCTLQVTSFAFGIKDLNCGTLKGTWALTNTSQN